MKAKELMIGDWVSYVDIFGEKVVGNVTDLTKNEVYEVVAVDNCHYDSRANVDFSDIEPIPLTTEILEANGFVWKELNKYFSLWFSYDEGIFISSLSNGGWNIQTQFRQFNISCNIRYVHELQHALRLCGLNEMADNFKLTKKGDNDNE